MLNLDDHRWTKLEGGYRVPFDPRSALRKLEEGVDLERAWQVLWDELHHQGDVGEASFATVPHLVRIYRQRGIADWNPYAMVGTIELARGEEVDPRYGKRKNPDVPDWLKSSYFAAVDDLANLGLAELPNANDAYLIRGILAILALHKGARAYGRLLLNYSEEELVDIESAAAGI
jgi:hypothetical protein